MSAFGIIEHVWNIDVIRPLVRRIVDVFGVERCFFGSNWPVDSLYGSSYATLIDTFRASIADHPADAREAMLSGNASRIYRI